MKLIGLTGGVGSGKSTVARLLSEQGIPVIDADRIGHALIEQDHRIREALRQLFGAEIFDNDVVSRERLADRVFNDDHARSQLNALLHPAIINAVSQRCRVLAEAGHPLAIVEAALLGESGRREPWLAALILVLAPEKTRLERLACDRAMPQDEARRRMAAQQAPESKIAFADWVIDNGGDLDALRDQVRVLVAQLHALSD